METLRCGVPSTDWERLRCRSLTGDADSGSHCWAAFARTHAVDHCVASATWRPTPGMGPARFLIFLSPVLDEDSARSLILSFVSQVRQEGATGLRTERAFPFEHPSARALRSAGFSPSPAQHRFRIRISSIRQRLGRSRLIGSRKTSLPIHFKTLREVHPALVAPLLASFSLEDGLLRSGCQEDLSLVILHGDTVGAVAILHRTSRDVVSFHVRAVARDFPGGRGLGNLLLLHELERRLPPSVAFCEFEARPDEHRETLSLARRLDAEELPAAWVWSLSLTPRPIPA